jgi:hypothetical protein
VDLQLVVGTAAINTRKTIYRPGGFFTRMADFPQLEMA